MLDVLYRNTAYMHTPLYWELFSTFLAVAHVHCTYI